MDRFLIGQYGGFDYQKFHRDYRDSFFGIETCLFDSEVDVENLIHESRKHNFQVGIHFPFRAGNSNIRDALVLAQDDKVREEAFAWIQQELDYLTRIKPNYVLFHYPKPVILDDRVDWNHWRFADASEYVYESSYSFEEFAFRSEQLFEWLSIQAVKYDFTPVLEFDALNRYIYDTNLVEQLLDKYSKIKLCLDTGRLFLQEKLDPFFDAKQIIRKYAHYAEVIHLFNMQFTDRLINHRQPVLPELDPVDGWAPIEEYLKIIREQNPNVKIQFEHRSDLVSDEDLQRCYEWVDQVMNKVKIR
ncbi:sugar phosphate isomerase/epimerase [Paenibacillus albiflavus]|uniref:Sugar phosphate isomerase/epimerase n=1 Tax=Paenibacillus albiflavus TaxID=2545760 RepID=A0A4R4EJH8_9BACL|nr:sugar phosphate isomerase/epimerase [Paenibacillus albiflavus]TCZ79867.1 sugar phosphate isomerase/epimerase [Paenibacillus albiflavus]